MGDFNTCLQKNDHRSSRLKSIVNASNMHILPLNATHHFPNSIPSLLDLIIVSSLDHVVKHGQMSAEAFSYHDLLFLSYKIRPPKIKPTVILQRNFSGMNREAFLEDAKRTDWVPVFNTICPSDQVVVFNSILTQLYDKHAPFRRIKIKHVPAPWLGDEIKLLMHNKALAKHKYRCRPCEANKEKYANSRNRCNRVCRDAQRRYIHKSVENGDPAKVWQFLKSLGVGKSQNISLSPGIDLDALNQHFSSPSIICNADKLVTLKHLSSISTPDYPQFSFREFTVCDVKKSLLSITSNAVGVDGITRNMLTPILELLLPVLCFILNSSISKGTFPFSWKEAHIIPIAKKSNPQSFSDYRPISILPFLSKVLERLVYQQLHSFLNSNLLLNPYQSGFRSGHSTVTALIKISDDIRYGMENGQLTVLTLLDFSNAFNTVDFDILLALLRSLNMSTTVIDWFHSYLFGRRQRVRLGESISSWCNTTAGVPQGGVLSPLLFSIFINSISRQLSSSFHLYADDLQIYNRATLENLPNAINAINRDLSCITKWSRCHGLKINPGKTQAIIIGSSRMIAKMNRSSLPRIVLDGEIVGYSDAVKNLGIIFDHTLSWKQQLDSVSRKMFASAAALRRLRNFLPTATKVALAQSILLPILDYADASYLDLTEDQLNKLERLQNFSIRFIFGLRKYDHISEFRKKLKWLPIRLRRNIHILCLLFNILFYPFSPTYLKERFQFMSTSNNLSLRSSENLLLQTPVHFSIFYRKSFSVEAVRLWNDLPLEIRRCQTIVSFRKHLSDFYLSL